VFNLVLPHISKWFRTNQLTLNAETMVPQDSLLLNSYTVL